MLYQVQNWDLRHRAGLGSCSTSVRSTNGSGTGHPGLRAGRINKEGWPGRLCFRYNSCMPDSRMDATMEEQNARHYCAVGRVAVEWTRFESYLGETVRMLAGVDNKLGECISAQIRTLEKMLDALSSLSDLRSPGIAAERSFKERLELIQSLANRRNQVINDVWTFDPETTIRWPTTIQRTRRQGPVPMATSEVEALALDIEDFSIAFLSFRREFLISLGLWPGP